MPMLEHLSWALPVLNSVSVSGDCLHPLTPVSQHYDWAQNASPKSLFYFMCFWLLPGILAEHFPCLPRHSTALLLAAAKARLSYIKLLKHTNSSPIQNPFEIQWWRYWITVSNRTLLEKGEEENKINYNYGNLNGWWQVRLPESLPFSLTVLDSCAVWCAQR